MGYSPQRLSTAQHILSTVAENNMTRSNDHNIIYLLIHTTPELSKEDRGTWLKHDRGNKMEPSITAPNAGPKPESGWSQRWGWRAGSLTCGLPLNFSLSFTSSSPYHGAWSRCFVQSCQWKEGRRARKKEGEGDTISDPQ